MEPTTIRKDFLYQDMNVGDYVIVGDGFQCFTVNRVIRFTPKMVSVYNIAKKKKSSSKLVYADACVVIDKRLITFYLLGKGK